MNFDASQRRLLCGVFDAFERRAIRYVVLRGHTDLPRSVPGSDVDALVVPADFERATDACERCGLDAADSLVRNTVGLAADALERPERAFELLAADAMGTLSAIERSVSAARPTVHGHRERSFVADGVAVHLVNHLAYASPMNGEKIRLDPAVETALFDNRTERDGVSIPAPADELLHLVCRGVYDYDGAFPDYYVGRCERLAETVLNGGPTEERFADLLSRVFYKADVVVRECVESGEYDAIRQRLFRFSEY